MFKWIKKLTRSRSYPVSCRVKEKIVVLTIHCWEMPDHLRVELDHPNRSTSVCQTPLILASLNLNRTPVWNKKDNRQNKKKRVSKIFYLQLISSCQWIDFAVSVEVLSNSDEIGILSEDQKQIHAYQTLTCSVIHFKEYNNISKLWSTCRYSKLSPPLQDLSTEQGITLLSNINMITWTWSGFGQQSCQGRLLYMYIHLCS